MNWISVDDRLPEYDKAVLGFAQNERLDSSFTRVIYRRDPDGDGDEWGDFFKKFTYTKGIITHWAEIIPPEEGK